MSATRTNPANPNCLVPPHPAAWAAFNAADAHAIEGKIKLWLPRGSEFSCSVWQLRFPPASEGGLQGRWRQGRLFALPRFFPKPGSLICSVFGHAADSGAEPGCSRHSGVPSSPQAAGLVALGTRIFRVALRGAGEEQCLCRWIPSLTVHLHPCPAARPSDEHQGQELPLTGEAKLRKQASSASIFQQQIKI